MNCKLYDQLWGRSCPTAVIVLLIAAGTHAGWNLLGKREAATTAFMLVANILICLFRWPVFVSHINLTVHRCSP